MSAAAVLAVPVPVSLSGQGNPQAPGQQDRTQPLVLSGTLTVAGNVPDTGTVVLHRVTPERSGAVDSVQVGTGGTFAFSLDGVPGEPAGLGPVFFAAYRHEGVVFFGPLVNRPEILEEPYRVEAWPSRPLPAAGAEGAPTFRVAFRNIFIEEGPEGWRVTDVFEVGHGDPVTWISPDRVGGVPVWAHPLPSTAMNVQATEVDVAAEDLRLDRGALEVLAPFPPGDRLFVLRYDLPSLEATFPMPGATDVVEFLVREPAPAMRVEGLLADAPMEIERGSVYRRWWAEDVRDVAPRVRLGEEPASTVAWVAVVLSLLLVGLGSWAVRRPRGSGSVAEGAPASQPRPRTRHELLLAVAHLDEAVAAGALDPAEAARRRTAILAELGQGPSAGP